MLPILSLSLAAVSIATPCQSTPITSNSKSNAKASLTNWEQISNVINLYPLAVDFNSTHELFPQIFAPRAFANYTSDKGGRQNLHGLKQIIDTFASDAELFGAQHLLGSIRIVFDERDPDKANSTSEAVTTAFGLGRFKDQQATFYGIYRDQFERIHGLGWRITTRFYVQQGPASGNVTLLQGP